MDALELLGIQVVTATGAFTKAVESTTVEGDPKALVKSLNLHRRHLTLAQRRQQVRDQLKEEPEQSDRAIGNLTGLDHKTVGKIRGELEKFGEIPHRKPRGRGAKGKHGNGGETPPQPVNLGDLVRELAKAGDVPQTIGRKLHKQIPAITVTATDVSKLLLADQTYSALASKALPSVSRPRPFRR